jgi:hypothetical protein
VQRSVYEYQVAAGGLGDRLADPLPLLALAQEIDRAGDVGHTLGELGSHRLKSLSVEAAHLVTRQRPDLEGWGLDQIGHAVPEAHAGGSVGGDVERAAVGEHARAAVDGPDRSRLGGGERCQVERIGMPFDNDVVLEIQLPLGDPDLRGRPLEQVDHERRGVVQTSTIREIGPGDGFSRDLHAHPPTSARG